jgi:hypothetical protein
MSVVSRAKQFGRDLAAHAIAPLLRRLAPDPKYFELWQSHGFHVLSSDGYQPIPDTRVLPLSLWNRISDLPGVDMREEQQKQLLSDIAANFKHEYTAIPEGASTQEFHYYLGNAAFEAVDAEMLFGLIFWNEQYLLQMFLSFNATFEVLWAGQWMHIKHPDLLLEAFPSYKAAVSPGSFWFRRRAVHTC